MTAGGEGGKPEICVPPTPPLPVDGTRKNLRKYAGNIKKYVGNTKEYVENMKEYEEIWREYEGIPLTI